MKSNLKQHITSMVKEIIPLGVPRHCSSHETSTTHLTHRCPSLDTDTQHVNTLNSLPKLMLPLKSPVLQQTKASAVASSSGSSKGSGGCWDSIPNCHVPMRKLQLNNNNSCSNKDTSLQPADGKVLQRSQSYNRDKEFAMTFCKQLNENLKVGKSPAPLPFSRPASLSCNLLASQKGSRTACSRVEQHDWEATEKEESTPCLATTPGGRSGPLKRQRESSIDRKESKRVCKEDTHFMPSSANISSSKGVHDISSPPKFVRRAILRTSKENGSLILDDRGRDGTKNSTTLSDSLARQLFREPRSESYKPDLGNLPFFETGHLKEETKWSGESRCQVGIALAPDTSLSGSCKFVEKCNSNRSSPASTHSSLPCHVDEVKIGSPSHQSELGPMCEIKAPKQEPDSSPRASVPSIPAQKNVVEKRGWTGSLDLELDDDIGLGLESCALSLSSSGSSEEEQLLSLQEILDRSTRVPTTPEQGAFSEPSTPAPKVAQEDMKKKTTSYKNTLEQMLKEKEQNQKSKELEMQLLQACKEDLLKLDEDEENANTEAALSNEQREFLQRFSVSSCAIRDIHPGEEIFTLANFGRLFSHHTLDLRKLKVLPNNKAQQTLLQSHPEQVLLLLSAGLFRRAYSISPCQPLVSRWLFQMMSVHPNPGVCAHILQAMTTIAISAAQHIAENNNKKFEVWVPSIQDIALVFLNMGASFVNLFPLEELQPSFTEGDLLGSLEVQPDGTRSGNEHNSFPEHNFENFVKYLVLCAALCPKAYTDEELVLLLILVCRVSLETCLQLLPTGDISCLLQHLLNNMTSWETQLPQVCQAITDLSEDHHNLRRIVQLLPCSTRGKLLKRHLSVAVISKLLNNRCTYKPTRMEFQLSDLRSYLPRMRPSSLVKGFIAAQREQQEADDCAITPDQQAYYLCYSLLALINEASNFEFLPSNQRSELKLLSAELEKHIKCDIRESEKMLYRSKVKDFVARIYTRWEVLLQRSRPQEGKLYDYWKPLPEDEISIHEERLVNKYPVEKPTEELQSEDSDSSQSEEEEEWVEEEGEVQIKSEEDTAGESEETTGGLQERLTDTKEEGDVVKVDDKDGEEEENHNTPVDEKPLGGSPEVLIDSDVDEELLKTDEELLEDDETLENDDFLMGRENDELEELELLDKLLE